MLSRFKPGRLAWTLELDRLDPQNLRQHRLVLPNLADHRLGCLSLEEELALAGLLGSRPFLPAAAVLVRWADSRAQAGSRGGDSPLVARA